MGPWQEDLVAKRFYMGDDALPSLFLMVEEDWEDPGKVRFLHHYMEKAECMELIPALGLVMEGALY